MANELEHHLLDSLDAIMLKNVTASEKIFSLFQLLQLICEEAIHDEKIHLKTLFSRLAFISQHFNLDKRNLYFLNKFRYINERQAHIEDHESLLCLGHLTVRNLILSIWFPNKSLTEIPLQISKQYGHQRNKLTSFKSNLEALLIKLDIEHKSMIVLLDSQEGSEHTVIFDIADLNEPFTKSILAIHQLYNLPLHINLLDCDIDEEGLILPRAFVIEPDYLMDVTSIASRASNKNQSIWLHNLKRFLPKQSTKHILIGNVANHILDVLIADSTVSIREIFNDLFKLYPLEWAQYSNEEVKEILQEIQLHYNNLKRVVLEDFNNKKITIGQIYIEPSFYCRDYGLQGRLDLFHTSPDGSKADIIELKSGKPFMANKYGINDAHYNQTLLYDLMINSAYQGKLEPLNYILYSKLDRNNLKFAPKLKIQQHYLLKIRNDLVAVDHALAHSPEMVLRVMKDFTVAQHPTLKGFDLKDLVLFEKIYLTSSELEQLYFAHYVCFTAREMILAKTGEQGMSKANGLAALWLENMKEKEDRFSVLNHLRLIENNSDAREPILRFEKTTYTAQLSNFRVGDIAVLYPHQENARNILKHQIFKCSILHIDEKEVIVRMRSAQFNQQIFVQYDFWNIEQDVLTSSFNHMYRGLFAFLASSQEQKQLLLGLQRPRSYDQTIDIEVEEHLTPEQKSIVYKAFNARDYFMIWGPPGTGKTSVVLKNIIKTLYRYSDEKVMLVAYTNRAVDEICDALSDAGLKDEFIRIGSRYSIKDEYLDNLLNNKISGQTTRTDIIAMLQSNRIFVSTVSSIIGKLDLFHIVNIKTIIIDEASQILEPALIGLLTHFERHILIGDHKQLPAVVTQSEDKTKVNNNALIEIGITDLRMSLFERLFLRAQDQGWDNAWAILSHQGRMHKDIMTPVNHHFYNGKLKYIQQLPRLSQPLYWQTSQDQLKTLSQHRLLYINTAADQSFNWKTNEYEADGVANLIVGFSHLYNENNLKLHDQSIGVITPYRAQIAMIKSKITKYTDIVTVDTVERYQGGARDIIIISLCTNRLSQLKSLVNLSSEGIDRKLNVALTRAKEQVVLIGNYDILSKNDTYAAIIDRCYHL